MDVDVLVIGMGPAGLQAAIYAARAKAMTVVVGKLGGSAISGAMVENYFGVSSTDGDTLLATGLSQAERFGAKLIRGHVLSMSRDGDMFKALTEDGKTIRAKAVVFATGVSRKKLAIPGEERFLHKGVSYCATCDCTFYRNVPVMLVGSESEAARDAAFMTSYASKVYWASGTMDVAPNLEDAARDAGVEILSGFPAEIRGDDNVDSVIMDDGSEVLVRGVFIEMGGRSSVDLVMDLDIIPEMDDSVKVDDRCMTTVPGVFVCGDLAGKPWQIAKAVGEGMIAGKNAAEYARTNVH